MNWRLRPLESLGDYIGQAIRLICESGAFEGGLLTITADSILIETGEGSVVAIERKVLLSDLTQLYTLEVI